MRPKNNAPEKTSLKKIPGKNLLGKNLSEKNLTKKNLNEKNILKKCSRKISNTSWKKWAQRAPLFAAEGCISPQELEKSRPLYSFLFTVNYSSLNGLPLKGCFLLLFCTTPTTHIQGPWVGYLSYMFIIFV